MANWWNDNRQDRDNTRPDDRRSGLYGSSSMNDRDENRDYDRDFGRDMGREIGREGREWGRELRNAFGRQPNRDSGRDYGRESGRDFGRDSGREFGRDYGRDMGRNYDRVTDYGSSNRDQGRGNEYTSYGQDYYNNSSDSSRNSGYGYGYGGAGFGGYGQSSGYSNAGSEFGDSNRSADYGFGRGGMNNQHSQSYGSTSMNRDINYGMGGDLTYQRNSYAGRGPKGYQRSDERIKEEVSEALARHPDIDASEIEVDVKEGMVTLRGHVDERRVKRMAEDAIEHLSGVRDIRNELSVNKSLFERAKDALTGDTNNSDMTSGSKSATSTKTKH